MALPFHYGNVVPRSFYSARRIDRGDPLPNLILSIFSRDTPQVSERGKGIRDFQYCNLPYPPYLYTNVG
jgi:hypothetical protein